MKNFGDVVGGMMIAYIHEGVSPGIQFQNRVDFLLLEG